MAIHEFLYNIKKQIEDKNMYKDNNTKSIIIIIDNENAIKWIMQEIKYASEYRIYNNLIEIYEIINFLKIHNINIYLMDVKSHEGELINEIADLLANQGLNEATENILNNNKNIHKQYATWTAHGFSAITNDIKRKCKYRSINTWTNYLNNSNDILIKHLKLWKITQSHWNKIESNKLSFLYWKFINRFRSGHIKLNLFTGKQYKNDMNEINCKHCNTTEDILHYLLQCDNYINEQKKLYQTIKNIYLDNINLEGIEMDTYIDIDNYKQYDLLRLYLYPFWMIKYHKLNDINQQSLIQKRIKILNEVIKYVVITKRLNINK